MGRPAERAPDVQHLKRSPPRSVAPWEDGTLAMCFAMLAYANTLPNGFVRTPAHHYHCARLTVTVAADLAGV